MTSRAYQVSATVPGGHPDVREVKPEQLSPSGRQVGVAGFLTFREFALGRPDACV